MQYITSDQLLQNRRDDEFVQYDERDPCYTWLYPLDLGDITASEIWANEPIFPPLRRDLTLYVHVPFCQFICKMCPFTHEPLKKFDLQGYVDALVREIEVYGQWPDIRKRPVSSLYFGGGTASSLSPEQLMQVLDAIRQWFYIKDSTEITLECHPRTVDRLYLAAVRSMGIDRVSFGIQSFNQSNISSLKLHQKVGQSRDILEAALETGFRTVAMDLMYRYPNQTVADLDTELDTVFQIGVHGLSVYALDADVGGLDAIKSQQASTEDEAEMYYFFADRLLDAGWSHVAQPDFALPGHENRQLMDLWGAPQADNLAFGAGAFSEGFNGVTWANVHNPKRYVELMNLGLFPHAMGQIHTWDDAVSRYPALGARCLDVPLDLFERLFGVAFHQLYRFEIERLAEKGWIDISENKLTITRSGKFFIDNISKTFFNLRNRGKPQLWGIQLRNFEPKMAQSFDEVVL